MRLPQRTTTYTEACALEFRRLILAPRRAMLGT
jgi:hypothetical protein